MVSVCTDALAIAGTLGGHSSIRKMCVFYTIVSIPIRKKIFGTRPIPARITFHNKSLRVYLRDAADISILKEVFVENEYAVPGITPPTNIVDIGGHAGFASIYFSLMFPNASIRTFEPDPANYTLLLLNTKGFPNIFARQAAGAGTSGTLKFYSSESSISSSLIPRAHSTEITVAALSLDDILAEQPADLVKFDIEGSEYDLFASAQNIATCATYIGEMHYDLIAHSREEFLKPFTKYTVTERNIGKQRTIIQLRKT